MKKNSQFGKPKGFFGRFLLHGMNVGHGPLARWALAQLSLRNDAMILDVGCGGGATIARLLSRYHEVAWMASIIPKQAFR